MTRIIAGSAKGRRLQVPKSGVRPTSDRVREAIFNSLGNLIVQWGDQRVLDLFAGTGALGLEALSRGAELALFVERDRAVAANLKRNLAGIGLGGETLIADALALTENRQPPGFSLIFADPPYSMPEEQCRSGIERWLAGGWIGRDAVVVLEGPAKWSDWTWPEDFEEIRTRRYGDTRVWYGSPRKIE